MKAVQTASGTHGASYGPSGPRKRLLYGGGERPARGETLRSRRRSPGGRAPLAANLLSTPLCCGDARRPLSGPRICCGAARSKP